MTTDMARLVALLLVVIGSGVACPFGYSTWYDGICFKLNSGFSTDQMRAQCNSEGAELASVHSEVKNANMLKILAGTSRYDLRIGLTCDNSTKGAYAWFDGTSLNFTNFATSQPCDSTVSYYMDRDDGKWYPGSSFQMLLYACELPHKSNSPCDDYDQVGDTSQCIKIHTNPATWEYAEQMCRSENAHLISIHDTQVNELIRSQANAINLTDGLHIGLTSNSSTKTFAWIDGSPFDYSNYGQGFPNDRFGHCSAMESNGSWISIDCRFAHLPFACNRPAFQPQGTLAPPLCDANPYLTGSGEIFSPAYPIGFGSPANNSCTWILAADEGKLLEIEFDDFESNECCDSLTLFDGVSGGHLIGTLTGSLPPNKRVYRTVRTNRMQLWWQTSSGVGVRGWHAHFRSV